jgi:hypothetical protein
MAVLIWYLLPSSRGLEGLMWIDELAFTNGRSAFCQQRLANVSKANYSGRGALGCRRSTIGRDATRAPSSNGCLLS